MSPTHDEQHTCVAHGSRRNSQAAEKAEGEKEVLTSTLSLDLSKDQEVLLKGYGGKKKKRNGSKVLILENMEKDEKLKVKVLESDDNSIEDLEIEVTRPPAFAQRTSRGSVSNTHPWHAH
jgi:hypothetical protein